LKQVDYDYSLLDIEEKSPLPIEESLDEISENHDALDDNKESTKISPLDKGDSAKQREFESQKTPTQEQNQKEDEDFKKRARIFKSF
jgi:hypothetical protein